MNRGVGGGTFGIKGKGWQKHNYERVHQERKKASGQQVRREHRQQLSIRGRLQQQQRGGVRGALPAPTPNQVQGKAQGMRAASRASTEEGGAPFHGILCCSIQNPANILNLSRERLTHQDSSAHHTASPCLSLSLVLFSARRSYTLPKSVQRGTRTGPRGGL